MTKKVKTIPKSSSIKSSDKFVLKDKKGKASCFLEKEEAERLGLIENISQKKK